MKKFYSFVLLAATLLLSTNIWAETPSVAKSATDTKQEGSILYIKDGAGKEYYYADQNECWEVCSTIEGVYTSVFVVGKADITIPSGKYVNICRKESGSDIITGEFTVTNNGNVRIAAAGWKLGGKFINNGMMEITGGSTLSLGNGNSKAFHIENNQSGSLFLLGNCKYYGYFTLTNNGGKVSVKGGKFQTEQAYNQIKDYIADGYAGSKVGSIWSVVEATVMVNGTPYGLYAGLVASSQQYPAVLMCNLVYTSILITWDAYLDLNGHTLAFDGDLDNTQERLITLGKEDVNAKGGSLTVSGKGTIKGNKNMLFVLKGSVTDTEDVVSALTIGKDVTIEQEGENSYYAIVVSETAPYGTVVNFDGKFRGLCPFYINGQITNTTGKVPEFNIGKTAEFECETYLAYAAGCGIWNYEGTATSKFSGFEIRAGKFTMNGGSITCTADKPADDQFNGNGSTSQACAVAACQHSTELPISVIINGGELKAYTPIYQANPQNNPQEAIDQVSVVVNDAKVYSTSQNIVWSANKKVVLNGGVYNLSPAAYVASDKAVVDNTDADTKGQYPYAIGKKATAMTTVKAGDWSSPATWSAEADATAIPTMATPVEIKHAVAIPASVKAQTCGIKVADGGKITVEGALIVGNDGITGITAADQLLIKDGASMVISPAAPAANSQPLATVELKTVIRDVKDGYQAGDRTYEYIWQNIGVPVTSMTIAPAKTLTVNTWDIVSAWVPATEFGTPFRGYHITNVDNKTAGMLYTFAGKLVGPQNAALSMPRDGFHFFGNSWTAPFDVKEILNQLQSKSASDDINSAVYVYISDQLAVGNMSYYDGQYVDINLAKLEDAATAEAFGQIAAMQGFFLHSDAKADIALNYEKAVWNAALAKPQPSKKPASMMEEENTAVRLILTAENGRSDELYLYEGEAYAAPKMMNTKPNVNIYAITTNGTYSTMGMDKIEGSKIGIQTNAKTNYTISFDWLKGETLYLRDKTADKYVAMLEDATYSFTAEANATIDDRFEIVSKSDVPGTGTAVEEVNTNAEATGIYTIMGQYVGETSMWSTLPAGMYIVNGKKCVK